MQWVLTVGIVVIGVILVLVVHQSSTMIPVSDLPDLDSGVVTVSDAQIKAFKNYGHTRINGLLSRKEVRAYAPHIRAAVEAHAASSRLYGPNADTPAAEDLKGGAFTRVDHLRLKAGGAASKLALSSRIAQAAAKVMQARSVRLYKDTAFFKAPGNGESPWHQDLVAAPFTCCFVTLWLALTPVRREMGALWFADGSHINGRFGDNLTVSGEEVHDAGFNITQTGAMSSGDATLHAGWTIHGAPPNVAAAGYDREAIALSYVVDGTRLISWDEWRQRGSDDKETWTMWQERGFPLYDAVIDNPLTPVVYAQKIQYVHDPRPKRRKRRDIKA